MAKMGMVLPGRSPNITGMSYSVRRLWTERRGLFLAFCAAALITVFFAARGVFFAVYWSDPAHRDQPIEGWMTPGYIAHSWGVSPELVIQTLDLGQGEGSRRKTLSDIAKARGVDVEVLIAALQDAISSGPR